MHTEHRDIDIGRQQHVSAVVAFPTHASGTAVMLAHGAGSDMTNPFLSFVHTGIAARGHVGVKFNFPYTERRRRAPDPPAVLEACYAQVLAAMRADRAIAAHRFVIGGKSMGGRMATHLAAMGERVDGLILLGYPLHPAGAPDKLRVAHLPKIQAPMLFFAGTRDPLCTLSLLQRTLTSLPAPVALHVIDGGDHSFNVPKSMHRERNDVWQEIVDASAEWLQQLG